MIGIRTRARSGDLFLILLIVSIAFAGAALFLWLRNELSKDLVASEAAVAASRVDSYLWGKIARFAGNAGAAEGMRGDDWFPRREGGSLPSQVVVPSGGKFERIRYGTGEGLPIYVGDPRTATAAREVLPLGMFLTSGRGPERFVHEEVSLSDLSAYLNDLKLRGVFCRIVNAGGGVLVGGDTVWPAEIQRRPDRYRKAPVLSGSLPMQWTLEVFLQDAGAHLPILPQAVLLLLFLGILWTLVFFRRKYFLPQGDAIRGIAESLESGGERIGSPFAPGVLGAAVRSFLDRTGKETVEKAKAVEAELGAQIRELTESRKSLIAHHRITKKMLQSRSVEEVFRVLIDGIVEGYGFQGAKIGTIHEDGHLIFPGETEADGPLRIPLWHPGSLLARTFWSNGSLRHDTPMDLPHLEEEELLIEKSPIFILHVMKTITTRCSDLKNCGDKSCPCFFSENRKCWLRMIPREFFQPDAVPETFRSSIMDCLRCKVFPASAMIVLRSVPEGKTVTRDNIVPISNLASEAGLALEVVSLYDNLKIISVTDGLTGLFNHREFYHALRRELERARRYRHPLSLLIIDVDDFKAFNDRFGHPSGDQALRDISDMLRKCARTTDIIARYGGEEFAVILPESSASGALMVAERIKGEVSEFNFLRKAANPVHLTVSIGIYTCDEGGISEDQIVSYADEAAYTAKKSGKNRVVLKASN